jgi:hypothetical protein
LAELFGFEIKRKKQEADPKQVFTAPQNDDGAMTVAAGGVFGQYLDLEGQAKNEGDLVRRYREVSLHPECDQAIEDIVSEAIVSNELKSPVRLDLENVKYGRDVKRKIEDEFSNILHMLRFNSKGHEIFRRWYVDGRLHYQKMIDRENPREGIQELRYIDPRKIKLVREVRKTRQATSMNIMTEFEEYFVFNEKGVAGQTSGAGIKITKDTIAHVTSGLIDQNRNMILSYLHKAIKPVNQLRMIEDSAVIYRIARAPERRIFYIDVGNLPKVKAEQYLRDIMARYRNKLVYDANTGEIRDDRNYHNMLEDYWLPRREGGRGTEITTLPGGTNLGEVTDLEYFRAKLYRSLNVPVSRLESSSGFNLGRAAEITRDELKFTKFVQRLRKKFNELFSDILKTQLILKGIINEEDWFEIFDNLQYDYLQDGHFSELKEAELLKERVALADSLRDYIGKYYSVDYIRKKVLRQSEREIEEIDKQIKKEINDGIIASPATSVGELGEQKTEEILNEDKGVDSTKEIIDKSW